MRRFLSGHGRAAGPRGEARAVVVEAESIPGDHGIWGCALRLRVHFDDGTTSEFSTKKRTIDLGGRVVTEGDILPVTYDATDRSTVQLDVEAIKAEAAAADRSQNDEAVARAEAELDGSAPPSAPTGSPAQFADDAAAFAASARTFLESSVADRAAKERAANGGGTPTETLRAVDQDHAAGLIDDDTYRDLRAKLTTGQL